MAYHPPQRAAGVFVLSLSTWIRGTLHLPKLHAFEEFLGGGRSFFTLTDVLLGDGVHLEFLALRATAAHLVVPEEAGRELGLPPTAGTEPRELSCYLENVAVHGTLELLAGVRTSDFLAHQRGFIVLRGCRIVPPLPGRPEPIPVVFVNAGAVFAVAEEGGRVGEQRADVPVKTPVPAA